MVTKKVWFVTGASKGLGLALVKHLLGAGHKVAATSRDLPSLQGQVEASANFLPLAVDLVNQQSVGDALSRTIQTFGSIDVVVNNAGYGQLGAVEELSDEESRLNFEVNVFGTLNVIRNVTSYFRKQGAGHIINISSIAGFLGAFPGWGIYNATKFAVSGLTEAYAAEVNPFGIHATVVYPGYFRTNFLLQDSLRLAHDQVTAYEALRKGERLHVEDISGNQPGNPEKAAAALLKLAESEHPPLHFFMGSDSFNMAHHKVEILQTALAANESLSRSTDH